MALPDEIRARAVGQINELLDRLGPPPDLADEVKLEATTRGSEITIVERRPPWTPEFASEWAESKIARLRYDAAARTWTLRYRTANGRWHDYEGIGPAKDLSILLGEIEADPTGIFWG